MSALFPENRSTVKAELVRAFADQLDEILDLADGDCDLRDLEKTVVRELLCLGRMLLSHLFALRCQRATAQDIEQRGLTPDQVRLRFDEDYWATIITTVGPVRFPWFAYRDLSRGHGTVTHAPARKRVLPYQRSCHSSPLCLEWEVRLGAQHPFRGAQDELRFFTHGAVTLEDTTISRHLLRVSILVDRSWMYRVLTRFARFCASKRHVIAKRASPSSMRPVMRMPCVGTQTRRGRPSGKW